MRIIYSPSRVCKSNKMRTETSAGKGLALIMVAPVTAR